MCDNDGPPQSLEEMAPTDEVWVAPATQATASRRSAHLSEDCEYCFENATKYEVQTMPNIEGLCDYCTGDPRSVDEGETQDNDWSTQKLLWRAADRAAEGSDPLEALAAEQRAQSETTETEEAE